MSHDKSIFHASGTEETFGPKGTKKWSIGDYKVVARICVDEVVKSPEYTMESALRSEEEVEVDCRVVSFWSWVSPVVAWDPDVCPLVKKKECKSSEPSDPEY